MGTRYQLSEQMRAEKAAVSGLLLALAVQCQLATLDGVIQPLGMKCGACEFFVNGGCDFRVALKT